MGHPLPSWYEPVDPARSSSMAIGGPPANPDAFEYNEPFARRIRRLDTLPPARESTPVVQVPQAPIGLGRISGFWDFPVLKALGLKN